MFVKCRLTFDKCSRKPYILNMALLRRSELPVWLLKKYGTASALATAIGVSRQTAHNLLKGRTIPSYENCERLGLSPAFVSQETEGSVLTGLDDFLAERERSRRGASMISNGEMNEVLFSERGATMLRGLVQATRAAATRVGVVNGVPFEWSDERSGGVMSPLLKLAPVGAQFKGHIFALPGSLQKEPYVDFGWVNRPDGIRIGQLADRIWRLSLTYNAGALTWSVIDEQIVCVSSVQLAEQITKCLVQYRDEYLAANPSARF